MNLSVALCQIDTVPGDVPGNVAKIMTAAAEADRAGADLAVFPELSIVGYCPRDLLFRRRFIEAADEATSALRALTGRMAIVVGTVGRNRGVGRPFTNDAVLLADGREVARVHKALLPAYDVFDEARYFEPGAPSAPVELRGARLGIFVCEDLWTDPVDWESPGYARRPVDALMNQGCDLLVNISASPYSRGKPRLREALVARTAAKAGVPLVLCNLVGGNDDVLFDGRSLCADASGQIVARGPAFREGIVIVHPGADHASPAPPLPHDDDPSEIFASLVMGVRDYAAKAGFKTAHLGLSGGIDSALSAAIATDALGNDAVVGYALPGPYSSPHSQDDARDLARRLSIRCDTIDINLIYDAARTTIASGLGPAAFGVTEENIQSRIRGMILMAISNRTGSMLLSTGNKSELAVGYCTLYGDLCGGLALISDVFKTDVYRISRWLADTRGAIPESSLSKPPSAELRPNQTDQDSLPPYDVLDSILREHLEHEMGARDLVAFGHDETIVRRVLRLVAKNEFKRHQAPPGLRISRKAFGQGRRIPIVGSGLDWIDAPDRPR